MQSLGPPEAATPVRDMYGDGPVSPHRRGNSLRRAIQHREFTRAELREAWSRVSRETIVIDRRPIEGGGATPSGDRAGRRLIGDGACCKTAVFSVPLQIYELPSRKSVSGVTEHECKKEVDIECGRSGWEVAVDN